MKTTQPHQGRNVKRLREMLGIKQDALAIDLGLTQQAVSLMEQKEELDTPTLHRIAEALKVPKEAIENMMDDSMVNIINNTFNDSDNASVNSGNSGTGHGQTDCAFNFNPLDKLMEAMEENKKLYERMLKEKDEMIAKLERLIEQK